MYSIIQQMLERLETISDDRIVLRDVCQNVEYTNVSFAQRVNGLAAYLANHMPREILLCADNSDALAIFYFACMFSGKVLIPVDPEKEPSEVERIKALHKESTMLDNEGIARILDQHELKEVGAASLSWEKVDFDRLFLITYTSGSTGTPKGVRHSAGSLFQSAVEFGEMMGYGTHTVMGHCMPMTYMAGILNTLIMPYVMGGTIVVLPRFSMKSAFSFWDDVKKGGVNTLWLSPTMLRIASMMDKRAKMREYLSENNVTISVGTAPLDKALRNEVEEKYGVRLYQSYGLSETLFVSTEVPEEAESKHTVGHLLPSVRLRPADDGELQISVPWMFLGYTNEDTAPYMKEDFYLSGDLGRICEDGNLVITGRKKELIVRGGYNINPRDIETVISELGVAECAVTSAVIRGEELVACAYVSDVEFPLVDVNRSVTASLGKHAKVDILERMQSIPKNLNGKVDKRAVAEIVREKHDSKI